MKILHSEPYIVLNMGLGSIDDVKEEIEYFNEDTSTTGVKLPKENRHPRLSNYCFTAIISELFLLKLVVMMRALIFRQHLQIIKII